MTVTVRQTQALYKTMYAHVSYTLIHTYTHVPKYTHVHRHARTHAYAHEQANRQPLAMRQISGLHAFVTVEKLTLLSACGSTSTTPF